MKKTIERLAMGRVYEKRPGLTLYREREEFRVEEDGVYEGSLTFMSDGELCGMITSSDYRMEPEVSEFAGRDVDIAYRFDSAGLKAGDRAEGFFTLITNAGEYEVPFAAVIEEPYIMAEGNRIESLDDFAAYASGHGPEAFRIFCGASFAKLLRKESDLCRRLYGEQKKGGLTELGMEEFLIFAGKKKKVELTLGEYEKEWIDPVISMKSSILLIKNTWGYMPVRAAADGEFLRLEKERVTGEDFTGKYYELEYVIEKEKLHAGNNYGKIVLTTPWQTLAYTVTVKDQEKFGGGDRSAFRLLALYIRFRLGKIHKAKWLKESEEILGKLRDERPDDEGPALFEAWIFLSGGRREEAGWLLERQKGRKKKTSERGTQAAFLYLSAVYEGRKEYAREATEEIMRAYAREKDNALLLWFLLQLDERLAGNREKKLQLILRQLRYGSRSSLLCMEACLICSEEPSLILEVDDLTLRILEFAVRKGALTKELSGRAAELAVKYKGFSRRLYRVLAACYGAFPSKEILTAVISLLMKGNRTDLESFSWYALGVEKELKLTRLYEYYILSAKPSEIEKLPRTVLMYFSYDNGLDDQRLAMLYDYVIRQEEEEPSVFCDYRSAMQKFMVEQLLMRKINGHLVTVYRRFLTEELLNNPMREALADIVCTCEVKVELPNITGVQAVGPDGGSETAPCRGGKAYVKMPSRACALVFSDSRGRKFIGSVAYEVRPLFEEQSFRDMCGEYAPKRDFGVSKGRLVRLEERMDAGGFREVYEDLKIRGMEEFSPRRAGRLTSRMLKELSYREDRFLLFLGRYAFCRGYCDLPILEYLAEHLSGPAVELVALWEEAASFGADVNGLGERLLSQLLFTGLTLPEEERVFARFAGHGGGEMLKKAYINVRSAQYFVEDAPLPGTLREEMIKMYAARGILGDAGRLGLIKYYGGRDTRDRDIREMLTRFMREFAGQGKYFACFFDYPKEFLRRAGIPEMETVEVHAAPDAALKIRFRADGSDDFSTEDMAMPFPGVFVKCFALDFGGRVDYAVFRKAGDETVCLAQGSIERELPDDSDYSREALAARIRRCADPEKKARLLKEYEQRERMLSDEFRMI